MRNWTSRHVAPASSRTRTVQLVGLPDAIFREIPRADLEQALHFIEKDGTVYHGAEAAFRSLGTVRRGRALVWGYEHLPGFAPISETAYRVIARNRRLASFFTRVLWGNEVRRP